ncbi:MAG: FHA domain-containing protein [Candidatus Competibacteraceae bacterium]|nr:FHA domain-containing protein [Candidatus Competibacteraceae bacterium]
MNNRKLLFRKRAAYASVNIQRQNRDMNYKLRHLDSGVPYLVKPGKNIVGRSSEADIQVDHESISRRHAQIENNGTILFVRDLNSTNGTFVSDQPVNAPTMIEIGTVVQIGEVRFRIDPESGGVEPPPPVVSWESYQRKTNRVPKAQMQVPALHQNQAEDSQVKSGAAPAGAKWGPAVTLPLQRGEGEAQAERNLPSPVRVTAPVAAHVPAPLPPTAPQPNWLFLGLSFGAGMGIGVILGLVLAKLLFS